MAVSFGKQLSTISIFYITSIVMVFDCFTLSTSTAVARRRFARRATRESKITNYKYVNIKKKKYIQIRVYVVGVFTTRSSRYHYNKPNPYASSPPTGSDGFRNLIIFAGQDGRNRNGFVRRRPRKGT